MKAADYLAPTPTQRAAYYRWLFLFSGPLEAVIISRALGAVILRPA